MGLALSSGCIASASFCYAHGMEDGALNAERVAAALRQISRGFAVLAEAIAAGPEEVSSDERYRRVMVEWGERGLTREAATALFRKHGFAPQAAGGWTHGDWMETRADGRRYLTERSHEWLAAQGRSDED
jgi:hypothetical protein